MEELPPPPPPESQDVSFDQLYNPLMRLVPPAIRHRPTGVEGSLKVVETFFGADISSKMVDAAGRLSKKQMNELDRQLAEASFQTRMALTFAKRPENLVAETFLDFIRKSPMERDFDKLLHARGQDDPFWSHRHIANAEEIGMHEGLASNLSDQATPLDICNVPALKHMALYCQQTAIRDPLYTPYRVLRAYQKNFPEIGDEIHSFPSQRRRIANGIRQLLPIAPLIRSGTFVLTTDEGPEELFIHQTGKNDPFLWWLLGQHRPDLQQEMTELYAAQSQYSNGNDQAYSQVTEQLQQLEPQAGQIVRAHYPYPVSDKAWQRMLAFSNWAYTYSLTPFTSDPDIVRHLQQGARIAFGSQPDLEVSPRTAQHATSPSSMAVAYQIPSLHDVAFRDIARLRNSSLFGDVRTATVELAQTCAESNPQSFDAYQQLVFESAGDIVGPLYRKLGHRRQLNKLARLGLTAGGKALKMEVSGVAGTVAAAGVKRLGKAYLERQGQVNETARGILRSLLDYR